MEKTGKNINGDKMRTSLRKLFIFCLSFIYILTLIGCSKQNELRLRIVSSSNNQIDVENKMKVKEKVKSFLLNNNLEVNLLEEYLSSEFKDLKIKVTHTYDYYEAKSYNNKIIPAGRYETILIEIGEAKGKNFWTILYPEYFNISFEDDHEVEYRSYLYDLINKKRE